MTPPPPCAPGTHKTEAFKDEKDPTARVCTVCGEIFKRVVSIPLFVQTDKK